MPSKMRVRIAFNKFKLEESASCKFDRVEVIFNLIFLFLKIKKKIISQIFEGIEGNDETLIGRYCGGNLPPVITSTSNIVTVKFTTDWSASDDGFQLQYQLSK
jgi:hypothetical protein